MSDGKIWRRPDVERETGLKRSTIYMKVKAGAFPKPIRLGPRSVGWVAAEVRDWVAARIAEREAA